MTTTANKCPNPQASACGLFVDHTDIGSPKLSGAAGYNGATEEYRLTGAGLNLWFQRDQCHFAWKKLSGDFILHARVEFVGQGVDAHRKIGWMVRSGLAPDAPYADAAIHGDGLTSLQFRPAAGQDTQQVRLDITHADVIQLERKGDTILFSAARHGERFVQGQVENLPLGREVFAGLFVCSHNPDVRETAIFRNVRITTPAGAELKPYRDYLGSRVEILDVFGGVRQVVQSSKLPFEAPNWTPDGLALICNSSGNAPEHRGRLHRLDLLTRSWRLIDTDFATRNNNDHVLSFDGAMLAISHHSADHEDQSVVYTVPVGGGVPKAITPLAPSYLHGWSPDGRLLVYTARRNGVYNIYRIAADGAGPEEQLTFDTAGLQDGPEYSPDGQFIYYCSTRTGLMQLWRMRPDGSEGRQISNDGLNDWFPHISPDGRWIAFLSYLPDVPPESHPYYQRVYLRLMPSEGGESRVIAYVYGGQGTLNVPSWSPDSRMLAFVSNSAME